MQYVDHFLLRHFRWEKIKISIISGICYHMIPPYGHSVDSLLEHREKRSFGHPKAKAINRLQQALATFTAI